MELFSLFSPINNLASGVETVESLGEINYSILEFVIEMGRKVWNSWTYNLDFGRANFKGIRKRTDRSPWTNKSSLQIKLEEMGKSFKNEILKTQRETSLVRKKISFPLSMCEYKEVSDNWYIQKMENVYKHMTQCSSNSVRVT